MLYDFGGFLGECIQFHFGYINKQNLLRYIYDCKMTPTLNISEENGEEVIGLNFTWKHLQMWFCVS